jgi:hypothetical protein
MRELTFTGSAHIIFLSRGGTGEKSGFIHVVSFFDILALFRPSASVP